jgi:hypothetical protein
METINTIQAILDKLLWMLWMLVWMFKNIARGTLLMGSSVFLYGKKSPDLDHPF